MIVLGICEVFLYDYKLGLQVRSLYSAPYSYGDYTDLYVDEESSTFLVQYSSGYFKLIMSYMVWNFELDDSMSNLEINGFYTYFYLEPQSNLLFTNGLTQIFVWNYMGFMGTQGKSIQYPSSEFNAALWYDVNTTIFLTDYENSFWFY